MEKRKLDIDKSLNFIKAGLATLTLKSLKTGKHFTYKVKKAKDANIYFVSVLADASCKWYKYIGMINSAGIFITTRGSKVSADAPSFKAFGWTLGQLMAGVEDIEDLEIWHEGRCGACGRQLTDPASISSGYGPVCASR